MRAATSTVRIYEVCFNADGPGTMGDGMAVRRFRSVREAEDFARGRRCYSGEARAESRDVPRSVAQRWGL